MHEGNDTTALVLVFEVIPMRYMHAFKAIA